MTLDAPHLARVDTEEKQEMEKQREGMPLLSG